MFGQEEKVRGFFLNSCQCVVFNGVACTELCVNFPTRVGVNELSLVVEGGTGLWFALAFVFPSAYFAIK